MSDFQKEIEILKDDNEYYNGAGKKYLSNSKIKVLLEDPASFLKPSEESVELLMGSYFHDLMLTPENIPNYTVVDASTRNTKIYKEAKDEHDAAYLLLSKEVDMIKDMAKKLKGNIELYDLIYNPKNSYEVPMIMDLMKESFSLEEREDTDEDSPILWKGKADIIGDFIIDLKTTSNLDSFRKSAYIYNYDSQAFIYSTGFKKPMAFLVVEKGTNRIGYFTCSDEFLERGRQKVLQAYKVWKKFFGPNAVSDVENYFSSVVL